MSEIPAATAGFRPLVWGATPYEPHRVICAITTQSGSVPPVQCPECGSVDDRVVDSRTADEGRTIRRRRECLTCARRFTTFERLEEEPLQVTKRSGQTLPFDAGKLSAGVRAAAHSRPITDEQIAAMVAEIEDVIRLEGGKPATERIGVLVLERLSELDQVAYLRFASVYKDFDDATDFARELVLLNKGTAPKQH